MYGLFPKLCHILLSVSIFVMICLKISLSEQNCTQLDPVFCCCYDLLKNKPLGTKLRATRSRSVFVMRIRIQKANLVRIEVRLYEFLSF